MGVLNFGMVGGGRGAFIGAVHRVAAQMDGHARLVAGALSVDREEALASGRELGLEERRTYGSWQEMVRGEAALAKGERIDWVSIVTPNHVHHEIARGFIDAGIGVVCEKPMVTSDAQARDLVEAVQRSGVVFGVTYNYTGYPLVRHAAALVRAGGIGTVRKVFVEYHQGWLATKLEATGQAQASWRTDPSRAGLGGAIGDIGSHAENLISTVTGLEIESVCADLTAFVPGRALDDDAAVLLRFRPGTAGGPAARGVLTASQVCVGEENNLSLRVYGTDGGLAWRQENPNELRVTGLGGSTRVITRGGPDVGPEGAWATRLPPGHPEGFFEAFANIYRGVIARIRDGAAAGVFPSVEDGARGVRFIQAAVASAREGGVWVRMDHQEFKSEL